MPSLSQHRPHVIPAEYGKNPELNSYGLFVTNPEYPALEVHIPSVQVGSSMYTLNFQGRRAQLLERDHRRFFEASLSHPTLGGRTGSGLFDIMRSANIDSITFAIVYKDLKSNWYKTNCNIARNVELPSGLQVHALTQEGISPPPVALDTNKERLRLADMQIENLNSMYETSKKEIEVKEKKYLALQDECKQFKQSHGQWRVTKCGQDNQSLEPVSKPLGTY